LSKRERERKRRIGKEIGEKATETRGRVGHGAEEYVVPSKKHTTHTENNSKNNKDKDS
jgi:hypothetical protein